MVTRNIVNALNVSESHTKKWLKWQVWCYEHFPPHTQNPFKRGGDRLWWSPHCVYVSEVGAELTVETMEFRFHSLSTWICSPGSPEQFPPLSWMERSSLLASSEQFCNNSLCLFLPFPPQNWLSFDRLGQVLQITTKSACEALPLRICTDPNLKCLLA